LPIANKAKAITTAFICQGVNPISINALLFLKSNKAIINTIKNNTISISMNPTVLDFFILPNQQSYYYKNYTQKESNPSNFVICWKFPEAVGQILKLLINTVQPLFYIHNKNSIILLYLRLLLK